jgi:hypothetical protein
MKRLILFLSILVFPLLGQTATPPPGSGTGASPYLISTVDHLYWITQNSNSWASEFALVNDIDASSTVNWNNGNGIDNIGLSGTPFSGKFHGRGYVISGLYKNFANGGTGFFGEVDGGTVDSLGLSQINFNASYTAFSLTATMVYRATNGAQFAHCFVTGNMTITAGTEGYLAGFAGFVIDGSISNSYCKVNLSMPAGVVAHGFITLNSGSSVIDDCYSASVTTGSAEGFCYINSGSITNSFFDSDAIGTTTSAGGTAKTGAQMKTQSTFTDAGWDFVNDWQFIADNYPKLAWENTTQVLPYAEIFNFDPIYDDSLQVNFGINPGFAATTYYLEYGLSSGNYSQQTTPAGLPAVGDNINLSAVVQNLTALTPYYFRVVATNGIGTAYSAEAVAITRADMVEPTGDPRQISTLAHLAWLSYHPEAWSDDFVLLNDIDAAATATWEDGVGFSPIGNTVTPFRGNFDGDGHTISNLTINRPDQNNVGLFGLVIVAEENVVIRRLGLKNLLVRGYEDVGGLIGKTDSEFTGGDLTVRRNYTSGQIFGENFVGGFIGRCLRTNVSDSYSDVDVYPEDTEYSGGFFGYHNASGIATIENCLSTGFVDADGANGFDGDGVTITGCFWDINTSGATQSSNGTGKTTAELTAIQTFTDAGWSISATGSGTVWRIDAGAYPVLSWQPQIVSRPEVALGEITDYTNSQATLNGSINPGGQETTYFFRYGQTSGSLNQTTAPEIIPAGFSLIPVTAVITGLTANTPYYIELVASNASGQENSPEEVFITTPEQVQPAGNGTSSPFQIASAANLVWLAENSQHWDKDFIQTADIDLNDSQNWYNGDGFRPIGSYALPFTGNYNGNKKTIRNLHIYAPRASESDVGFFGYARSQTITDLAIIDATIEVDDVEYVGVLVGESRRSGGNDITISGCMASGTITAANGNVGGLLGYANNSGSSTTISNCYSWVSISAAGTLAGFIANSNSMHFTNCYASGQINDTGDSNTAGFIYQASSANFTGVYWDSQTTGEATSDGGVGRTTAQMQQLATFSGWSISTVEDAGKVWYLDTGNNYPVFQWQAVFTPEPPTLTTSVASLIGPDSARVDGLVNANLAETDWYFEYGTQSGVYDNQTATQTVTELYESTPVYATLTGLTPNTTYYYRLSASNTAGSNTGSEQSFTTTTEPGQPEGSGTAIDPYAISNLNELIWVSEHSAEWDKYFVLKGDINAAASTALNDGAGFIPIGNSSTAFSGTWNGKGHQILNLYINRPATDGVGLFGVTDGAVLDSIGLTDATITGEDEVGALAGKADNTTIIRYCFSSGAVAGVRDLGGLLGLVDGASTVSDCYAQTDVTSASGDAGGLIGEIRASVNRCYSSGSVSGNGTLGGLVGRNSGGSAVNCFWDIEGSGRAVSAGGIGKSSFEMTQLSTFTGWDFAATWRIQQNSSRPYLSWQVFAGQTVVAVAGTGSQVVNVVDNTAIGQISISDVTIPGDLNISLWLDIPMQPTGISGTISQYRWIIEPGDLVIDEAAGYSIRFNLADLFDFGGINEYTGADPNVSDIRLYKRDTPGSGAFAQVPGFLEYYNNGTIGDQRDDYVITPLITDGFSEFAFGTEGDHSLPVELSTFRATGKDRQVELFWKTASELLNSGFDVYRSDSEEGEYQEISSYRYNEDLEGLGTSAHGQDYRFTDNDFRLLNDATYYYKIADVDVNGVITMHGPVTATPTASEGDEQVARLFKLYPNYPNPFNPTTTIVVDLEEFTDEALIEVYDITGRLVKTLYNGPINQYRIMVEWDGTNNAGNTLSTRMYFYRYRSANRDIMRKMILMK